MAGQINSYDQNRMEYDIREEQIAEETLMFEEQQR
jgi:hypothetical protein